MGTCSAGRNGEPQKNCSVPWMRDWRNMSRERRRKAGLDSVDSVNGRNKRTCKKLDSVAVVESAPQMNEELMVVFTRDELLALV